LFFVEHINRLSGMKLLIAGFVLLVDGARVAQHEVQQEEQHEASEGNPFKKWGDKLGEKFKDMITSDDPDVNADMVQIVRKHGYPIEEHEVITEDGYILTNFRIPHGIAESAPASGKPVVFV
jgi:hypothetical protein